MSDKVRENYLRRWAKRLDLVLRKSKARQWSLHNQQGYILIDPATNAVVSGGDFDLSLDEVQEYLDDYEAQLRENA